jgi:hypothetical protein
MNDSAYVKRKTIKQPVNTTHKTLITSQYYINIQKKDTFALLYRSSTQIMNNPNEFVIFSREISLYLASVCF